jgi:hypothetical protein
MAMEPRENEAAGEIRIEAGSGDRVLCIEAAAAEPPTALAAGLRAILALATGRDHEPPPADVATAAPIQGRGADLAALFAALADDLLDQLAAMGGGFGRIRLDGCLRTDDGGWTAWGYLLGRAEDGDIVPFARRGPVELDRDERGRVVFRCFIERRP